MSLIQAGKQASLHLNASHLFWFISVALSYLMSLLQETHEFALPFGKVLFKRQLPIQQQ